jgi:hypothetical protein
MARLASRLGSFTLAALVALGALGTKPVRAAEPAWAEMIEMFAAACLSKFPDDVAVRQYAVEKRLTVMPDEMVRQLLGADPGQGWVQDTARGRYLLTIEMPPFHACAIRRTDSATPDFLASLMQVLDAWAGTQPGTSLKPLPQQNVLIQGSPTLARQWVVDRGPGKPTELLMVLVTNLNNKTAVRLVRQIKAQ